MSNRRVAKVRVWRHVVAERLAARPPFNDLLSLPPKVELETRPILKAGVGARSLLAELKQAAELVPSRGALITSVLPRDAQASSEIENIVTTADRLFRYLQASDPGDAATKEALRYRHALLEGWSKLRERPLSTSTAETICSRVKGVETRVRTGRVLNSLFLVERGLLPMPILCLSRYMSRTRPTTTGFFSA